MSFTSNSIVRKHLLNSSTPEFQVEGLRINLSGTNDLQLPHANLVSGSTNVKWPSVVLIYREGPITMQHGKSISLANDSLISGSVVLTLGDDLSTVYAEEHDFQANHKSGSLTPLSTGAIPNNTPVLIYYQKYDLFSSASDYTLNLTSGTISRRSGSAIPDGATVLIDYTVAAGSVEDELIDQAIIEAEDIILRSLAEGYDDTSHDQGLVTGATQLALSIVARGMAADVLIMNRASDAYNRSKEWQQLAETWEAAAWETLSPFLDPHAINSPVVE